MERIKSPNLMQNVSLAAVISISSIITACLPGGSKEQRCVGELSLNKFSKQLDDASSSLRLILGETTDKRGKPATGVQAVPNGQKARTAIQKILPGLTSEETVHSRLVEVLESIPDQSAIGKSFEEERRKLEVIKRDALQLAKPCPTPTR